MEIKIRGKGKKAVVYLSGRVSGEYSLELSKTLAGFSKSEFDYIIVDLNEVEYIDSPGLGGIIYAYILLEKNNKQIVLAAPQNYVDTLFRDCTIDKKIKIVNSYDFS